MTVEELRCVFLRQEALFIASDFQTLSEDMRCATVGEGSREPERGALRHTGGGRDAGSRLCCSRHCAAETGGDYLLAFLAGAFFFATFFFLAGAFFFATFFFLAAAMGSHLLPGLWR